ncbi:MAG: HD domain-containing protein [Gemmatimonadales bacterium]
MSQLEVVRDPLWNNIRLDPEALAVVDTPALQRLRYVRQLGHAFLVYPGATHTRFEHALGAYHLARRALARLEESAGRDAVPADAARHVRLATLLHDIGHYPFSHALEEAGLPHHEALAARHLGSGELALALERAGVPPEALLALIQSRSTAPLAGLVSGPVDVDKLDYLSRDAMACGVPYGLIDVDRLLTSLVFAAGPGGAPVLALHEKGLAALESLLFAKYQMYRNVYWHHAVRSATAMFKRLVRRAIAAGQVTADRIALATDDGLIHELMQQDVTGLAHALRQRRLAKRGLDVPAADLPSDAAAWPGEDPDLLEQVEDRLARELGLEPNELFLDFPHKQEGLVPDVPVARRDGRLAERPGLPPAAAELMRSARRLRVFVMRRADIPTRPVIALVTLPRAELVRRLDADRALLA